MVKEQQSQKMFFKSLKGKWKKVGIPESEIIKLRLDGFMGLEELEDSHAGRETFSKKSDTQHKKVIKNSFKRRSENTSASKTSKWTKLMKQKHPTMDVSPYVDTESSHSANAYPNGKPEVNTEQLENKQMLKHSFGVQETLDFEKNVPSEVKEKMKQWDTQNQSLIPPSILFALYEMRYFCPMPIQSNCFLPSFRDRKDIIGVAETGSGKTLAFGIPIVCSVLTSKLRRAEKTNPLVDNNALQGLIILPSRELAVQVHKHLEAIILYTPISIVCIIGGIFVVKQIRQLNYHPDIVVGTPGRLLALMKGSSEMGIEASEYLSNVRELRHLVLDEADRLIAEGEFEHLKDILKTIYFQIKQDDQLQTFVFSATLSVPQKQKVRTKSFKNTRNYRSNHTLEILLNSLRLRWKKVYVVDLTVAKGAVTNASGDKDDRLVCLPSNEKQKNQKFKLPVGLSIFFFRCEENDKELQLIIYLLKHFSTQRSSESSFKVLIFVNSISYVYRLEPLLSLLLSKDKHRVNLSKNGKTEASDRLLLVNVFGIHSSLTQKQRLKNLDRFQQSHCGILVCTDIAARGLDIPLVNAIVHFQLPKTTSLFVHRSGRTARANKAGTCICFSTPKEMTHWEKIYATIGRDIRTLPPPNELIDVTKELHSRIHLCYDLAVEIESSEHMIRKQSKTASWLRKAATEADVEMLSDFEEDETDEVYAQKKQLHSNQLRVKKAQLMQILKDPFGYGG